MEPLWSPVVATGGNRSQITEPQKRQKQAKTVAVGCHRLPRGSHGKEGVDGSSPSEGSAKVPQSGASCFWRSCKTFRVRWVWSPLWSPQVQIGLSNYTYSGLRALDRKDLLLFC